MLNIQGCSITATLCTETFQYLPAAVRKYSTLDMKYTFECRQANMSSKNKKREDFKQEDVLQAVVIADSFNIRFAPITKDKPRVSTVIQVE